MRMAELAMRSGVPRETIHFYLREGLLRRPRKGGRTVAYYDQEHLDRLLTIRRLREEKYLPLAVIRRLLDSPAAEQDVNTLAEVLHILPAAGAEAKQPSAGALREAVARGLLGRPRGEAAAAAEGDLGEGPAARDPAERRVLAIVDEALALEPAAQRLTLDDLGACASVLETLVHREAQLFFDLVFETEDIGRSVAALRSGRGPVARFITAFRDLMLRRIVEELLLGIQHGPDVVARAATVPLSARKERELGTFERRAAMRHELAVDPGPRVAASLVWHLFSCGASAELAALPPEVAALAGPRAAVLVAWGSYESARTAPGMTALEEAGRAAGDFALGRILVGEAALARGLRRPNADAGFLERSVPALHKLLTSDPESDPEPAAQALGHFHRGRVEAALPRLLGHRERAVHQLERAIALCEEQPMAAIDPAARARVVANAHLTLARHFASLGETPRARAHLERAAAVDPGGPVEDVVREELSTRSVFRAARGRQ
jgi:DNA-binding transcriptional MerR regulator